MEAKVILSKNQDLTLQEAVNLLRNAARNPTEMVDVRPGGYEVVPAPDAKSVLPVCVHLTCTISAWTDVVSCSTKLPIYPTQCVPSLYPFITDEFPRYWCTRR